MYKYIPIYIETIMTGVIRFVLIMIILEKKVSQEITKPAFPLISSGCQPKIMQIITEQAHVIVAFQY